MASAPRRPVSARRLAVNAAAVGWCLAVGCAGGADRAAAPQPSTLDSAKLELPAPAPVASPPKPMPSSGDAELDYWRQVAVGPIDELFERAPMFSFVRLRDYPRDDVLWSGVERMVIEIRDNPSRPTDEALLATLRSVIEGTARPPEPSLREFVPMLRQRRQKLRERQQGR
jgi:hypothetical protein